MYLRHRRVHDCFVVLWLERNAVRAELVGYVGYVGMFGSFHVDRKGMCGLSHRRWCLSVW